MGQNALLSRLAWFRAWHKLSLLCLFGQAALLIVCSAAALAVACDRLLFLGLDPRALFVSLAGLLLLSAAGLVLFTPCRTEAIAHEVDVRAGLKNLLVSGLDSLGRPDEISGVIVRRAESIIGTQSPPRLLPLRLTRSGRFLPLALLVLAASFFIPRTDLLGRRQQHVQALAEKAAVKDAFLKLTAKLNSIDDRKILSQNLQSNVPLNEFAALATNLLGMGKQEALTKLGEFENKYRDEFSGQRDFEKAGRLLKPDLNPKDLPEDVRKKLQDLVKSLNQGDLDKSAKTLRDLAQQLKNKQLSNEEKKACARELAKTLEKMKENGANISEDLAKQLRDMASSPENLEKMTKNSESCSKGLEDLANSCESSEQLSAMKEAMKEAKQSMTGDSFKDFNSKEVEKYLESEQQQCQLGTGMGGTCPGGGQGEGTGGEGQGRGGQPLENASETAFQNKMSPSKVNQGKILQQLFVSGIPEKGEALVEYTDVIKAAKQDAASSLARDRIPREYEGMIKTYFDSIEPGKKDTPAMPDAPTTP